MGKDIFPNYDPVLEKIVEASMTIPGESGMAVVLATLNALGWDKGDEQAFRIVPALILSFYDELSAKLLFEEIKP